MTKGELPCFACRFCSCSPEVTSSTKPSFSFLPFIRPSFWQQQRTFPSRRSDSANKRLPNRCFPVGSPSLPSSFSSLHSSFSISAPLFRSRPSRQRASDCFHPFPSSSCLIILRHVPPVDCRRGSCGCCGINHLLSAPKSNEPLAVVHSSACTLIYVRALKTTQTNNISTSK